MNKTIYKLPDEKIDAIQQLRIQGKSVNMVASKVGVHTESVWYYDVFGGRAASEKLNKLYSEGDFVMLRNGKVYRIDHKNKCSFSGRMLYSNGSLSPVTIAGFPYTDISKKTEKKLHTRYHKMAPSRKKRMKKAEVMRVKVVEPTGGAIVSENATSDPLQETTFAWLRRKIVDFLR